MVQQTLKLVKPSDIPLSAEAARTPAATDGSLRFEQRRAERHHVTLRATAVTKPLNGGLNRIRSLQLLNLSDGGIGAACQEALEPGSTIAIFIPPHGPERGLDVYGRVVRCASKDYGFDIGIAFDAKLAA